MTDALKVLGQVVPSATILTTLYTVPSATQTSVSSIFVCNQSGANILFNISVAVNGAADNPKQYIYFQVPLDPNDSFVATVGLSLATGDIVRVLSDTGSVSFNLFGVEVTV